MHHLFAIFAQAEKQPTGPFGDSTILILMALVFVAFYFIVIMPMKRREKKERENLFGNLKKNDEVLTASGIIGIVAMVKDDEVVLKVDESSNVRLRVLKSSIARIMNPKEPAKDAPGKAGQDASTTDNIKAGNPPAK
jgi:preprotein translocase subunit YajC